MKEILATSIALLASTFANAEPLKSAQSLVKPQLPMNVMTAQECEVWNRELSFSKSVENHDARAFEQHLHPGAVFGAGTAAPDRGPDAIVKSWTEIIDGKRFVLRWHPQFVSIGGDPDIALSSGPAWIETPGAPADKRYTISRFTSTWVKDGKGPWRVLFDAGTPPKIATREQVEALVAAQSPTCPGA